MLAPSDVHAACGPLQLLHSREAPKVERGEILLARHPTQNWSLCLLPRTMPDDSDEMHYIVCTEPTSHRPWSETNMGKRSTTNVVVCSLILHRRQQSAHLVYKVGRLQKLQLNGKPTSGPMEDLQHEPTLQTAHQPAM